MDPEFWMVTFGDLLSLLITFFVLLFSMSTLDDQTLSEMFFSTFTGGAGALSFGGGAPIETIRESEQLMESRQLGLKQFYEFLLKKGKGKDDKLILTSMKGLTEALLASDVTIKKRGPSFALSFPSESMFRPGSAELSGSVRDTLKRLAGVLRYSESDMMIEGHTDDTPISSWRYPSNWELSAARAAAVMTYLNDNTQIGIDRIRAAGYADTMPVVKNISNSTRARNRRVEIVVRQAPEGI